MTGTAHCRMMKVKIGSPGGNERGALEGTPGLFFPPVFAGGDYEGIYF